MANNRDDFSQTTIERAAARVGYLCSMCKHPTKGASMENSAKVSSIGVAAHICAAAPGGPRYDPSMTTEERKGIENCLWLCQTHSKVIDTDVVTYTVEKLKEIKKEAEIAASQALASTDYFNEYYYNNGDDVEILEKLFENKIVEGNYSEFEMVLSQYRTGLSKVYDELIFRQRIIYAAYCRREELKERIKEYLEKTERTKIDQIAGVFISMQLSDELRMIMPNLMNSVTIDIARLILNNEFVSSISSTNDTSTNPFFMYSDLDTRIILRKSRLTSITRGTVSMAENEIEVSEFYYEVINAAYRVLKDLEHGQGDIVAIKDNRNHRYLHNNIAKIRSLDTALQVYPVFVYLLGFMYSPEEFNRKYQAFDVEVKQHKLLQSLKYEIEIRNHCQSIDGEELLAYAKERHEWKLLNLYIDLSDEQKAIDFLNDHQAIFRLDSCFLRQGFRLYPDDRESFLMKYHDLYSEDFSYHCLMAGVISDEERKNQEVTPPSGNQTVPVPADQSHGNIGKAFRPAASVYSVPDAVFPDVQEPSCPSDQA